MLYLSSGASKKEQNKEWFSRGLRTSKVRCIVGLTDVGSAPRRCTFGQKRNSKSPESRLTSHLALMLVIDLFGGFFCSQFKCRVCTRMTQQSDISEVIWQCWVHTVCGKGQHSDTCTVFLLRNASAFIKHLQQVHCSFWVII